MSSGAVKEQLVLWARAMEAWDRRDFVQAFDGFVEFADFSKIHFNVGMCAMRINDLEEAIAAFGRAIDCDEWFAIAYMQRGVCLYHSSYFDEALQNFEESYKRLRGNFFIDYTLLGMPFQIFACHAIFNIALCHIQLGDIDRGLRYFSEALKAVPDGSKFQPDVTDIREALRYGAQATERTVPYEVSPDYIFRPQEDSLKNAERVDYLGSAKVVAGADAGDNYTGFSGRRLQELTLGRKPRGAGSSDTTGVGGGPVGLQIDKDILTRSNTSAGSIRPSGSSSGSSRNYRPRKGSLDSLQRSSPNSRSPNYNTSSTLRRAPTSAGPRTPGAYMTSIPSRNEPSEMGPNSSYGTQSRSRNMPQKQSDDDYYREKPSGRVDLYPASPDRSPRSGGGGSYANRQPSAKSVESNDTIRVKCHYSESRIFLFPYDVTFRELRDRISAKFAAMNDPRGLNDDSYLPPPSSIAPLKLKYKDETGRLMLMVNDDDLNEALEIAPTPGKLEIWCFSPNDRS